MLKKVVANFGKIVEICCKDISKLWRRVVPKSINPKLFATKPGDMLKIVPNSSAAQDQLRNSKHAPAVAKLHKRARPK